MAAAVYSNVPMLLAAAIVELLPGSLTVPELAIVVDTTKVLLAILRIALELVMFKVGLVKEPVPPTV